MDYFDVVLSIEKPEYIKGRGAQLNTHNHFLKQQYEIEDAFKNYCYQENEATESNSTQYIEIFPKSIVNIVTSADLGFEYSLNPYQGCEHGCIYCYARNTHEYWGYSAGLDFERKILFKKNAPELLEKKLQSNQWIPKPIVLSGNTDCYQPIEKKLEITRKLLEVFLLYKHPVSIITKNALILRDIDLLRQLAEHRLVNVSISITSLHEEIKQFLEPRTASVKKRLETVATLSANHIPVNVMIAPIIPSVNSHEIFRLVKAASEHGALSVAYTLVRLNGAIGKIFTDWLQKTTPDRASKIIHQIEACHGGYLNDSQFGRRMKGEGKIAEQIALQFRVAKNRYFKNKQLPQLNLSLFTKQSPSQYKLF